MHRYALSHAPGRPLYGSTTGLCWHGRTQPNLGSLVPATHQSPHPVALPSMPISPGRNNTQNAGEEGMSINAASKS